MARRTGRVDHRRPRRGRPSPLLFYGARLMPWNKFRVSNAAALARKHLRRRFRKRVPIIRDFIQPFGRFWAARRRRPSRVIAPPGDATERRTRKARAGRRRPRATRPSRRGGKGPRLAQPRRLQVPANELRLLGADQIAGLPFNPNLAGGVVRRGRIRENRRGDAKQAGGFGKWVPKTSDTGVPPGAAPDVRLSSRR